MIEVNVGGALAKKTDFIIVERTVFILLTRPGRLLNFESGRLVEVGAYSRLGAY